MSNRTIYALAGGFVVVLLIVGIAVVANLGGENGVTLAADQTTQPTPGFEPQAQPSPEPGVSGQQQDPGFPALGADETEEMIDCLAGLGLSPSDFEGDLGDPNNPLPEDFGIEMRDDEMYFTLNGVEFKASDFLACLPAADGVLGDLNPGDLDLDDLPLGDLDFGDLNLDDLPLDDLFDMDKLQECFDLGFGSDITDPNAVLEDPEGFLDSLPPVCVEALGL